MRKFERRLLERFAIRVHDEMGKTALKSDDKLNLAAAAATSLDFAIVNRFVTAEDVEAALLSSWPSGFVQLQRRVLQRYRDRKAVELGREPTLSELADLFNDQLDGELCVHGIRPHQRDE